MQSINQSIKSTTMTLEEKEIKRKEYQKKYRSTPEAKERHRLHQAQWRKENREKHLEILRRSYAKNKNKYNETRNVKYHTDAEFREKKILEGLKYRMSGRRKELYHNDPNKTQKLKDKWAKIKLNESAYAKRLAYTRKYKDEVWIQKEREQRENLSDNYVIRVIKKQFDFKIKTSEIPKEIIEIKKNNIKIKRLTKK